MRTTQIQDPFLHNQPEMTFAEDLAKPLHTEKPPRWNSIPAGENEVDFSEVKLEFDFTDLEYISSAGLRVLLIMQKRCKRGITLKCINDDIREILEQTGFDSILNVE